MSDLVTGMIVGTALLLMGLGLTFLLWMLKKLGTFFWEKYQVRRAAKQPQPEPQANLQPVKKTPVPPEYKLRVLSYFECPRTGPYYMIEHPEIIKSFIKGQTMEPHYENLFPRTVTWVYIPPEKLKEGLFNDPADQQ